MYNLQHSHLLAIDRASGRISLAQKLDYEAVREVGVRLVARDQGQPAMYTQTSLTITVQDEDDQNPVFSHDRCVLHVCEIDLDRCESCDLDNFRQRSVKIRYRGFTFISSNLENKINVYIYTKF